MRIAVCVTPPGRSAIASIQVKGFDSLSEFDSFFEPANKKQLSEQSNGRVVFGRWTNLQGTSEELVVSVVSRSEIDIHCHGGPAAVAAVLETMASIGFDTQANSRVESVASCRDLESELNSGLLHAPTQKIADRFLGLAQGHLKASIENLRQSLNESVDIAIETLRDLRNTFSSGQYLGRPAKVILAGPPNVGKSSLNNCILGHARSIIFDQPGTTRDVVSDFTTIDGWHFEFSDTAGIRESNDEVEQAGVDLARQKVVEADLVVWVHSAENFSSLDEMDFAGEVQVAAGISVLNKTDLLTPSQRESLEKSHTKMLLTDALSGEGIDDLMSCIKRSVIDPEPAQGQAVIFTNRQRSLVENSLRALESGETAAASHCLKELIGGS